nr:MAG TPA: hypothetical protein [Caudoviricetes sp.]
MKKVLLYFRRENVICLYILRLGVGYIKRFST